MSRYTQPKKTRFYPVGFKIKAVELSLRGAKDIAQALDIHLLMLSRWRKSIAMKSLIIINTIKTTMSLELPAILSKNLMFIITNNLN